METIRISSSTELRSAIPSILGFHPTESVVMLCLTEQHRLGPVMRADLADLTGDKDVRQELTDTLIGAARQYAAAVVIVVYSDNPNRAAIEALTAHISKYISSVEVTGAGNEPAPVHATLAAERALSGRRVLTDRAELVACVQFHDGAPQPENYETIIGAMDSTTGRDDYLRAHLNDEPTIATLIEAAQATGDDDATIVNLCAVLAAIAYRHGDGALARVALDRARDIEPDHRLSNMLDMALSGGLPPETLEALAHA